MRCGSDVQHELCDVSLTPNVVSLINAERRMINAERRMINAERRMINAGRRFGSNL